MKDANLKKFTTVLFFVASFASICFVAGIPLIVISTTMSNTFGLVMGIFLVVFGFYGSPLLWISYADFKQQDRVSDAVTKENIYTVNDIATQNSINKTKQHNFIDNLIYNKYNKKVDINKIAIVHIVFVFFNKIVEYFLLTWRSR